MKSATAKRLGLDRRQMRDTIDYSDGKGCLDLISLSSRRRGRYIAHMPAVKAGGRDCLLLLSIFLEFSSTKSYHTSINQKLSYQDIILIRQSFIVPLLFCKIVPNSAPIVPYAPHSGRWASRGASRLVRPVKRNKNGPMSKLTGPFLFLFSGC